MKEKIIGFLAAALLRALKSTLRWEMEGLHVDGVHLSYYDRPVILAFWHCDQLLAPWAYLGFAPPQADPGRGRRPASVLISEHSDGRIIAWAMHFLGIKNIAGSSTRGGVRALVQMKKAICKDQWIVTITPDGPKGPARVVKPGIVTLAAQTGAPILPFALGFERCWKAKSWDQMMLPKPFSRARIVGGGLVEVPKSITEDELHEYCDRLTGELERLKALAERPYG